MRMMLIVSLCCITLALGCGRRQDGPEDANAAAKQEALSAGEETPVAISPGTPATPAQGATDGTAVMDKPRNDGGSAETSSAERWPSKLGDAAWPVTGLEWIKGGPVEIKPGTVYVVEFWATWCPPCRVSIPHLTETQRKYKDKNLVVVGISKERVDVVRPFVDDKGDTMDYAVAVDATRRVYDGYMKAFGRNGIPCAFIVDAAGKLAWVGHPMGGMDDMLEQVLAGTPSAQAGR